MSNGKNTYMISDIELAKRLANGDNIDELLSDSDVVERLNDPLFERFLLKFLRAKAIASLPRAFMKIIEEAEEGNIQATKMLFEQLNVDFTSVENTTRNIEDLKKQVLEVVKKYSDKK